MAHSGDYHVSAHDQAAGFLHCSTFTKHTETLRRYYTGQDDQILVAGKDDALSAALKWEHSPSRGEDFPHLYAPLACDAIKWARPVTKNAAGDFVLPAL